MFFLDKDVDLSCPNCPVKESDEYVEFHYRRKHGTLDKLRDYSNRIKRYREAAAKEPSTVAEFVAMILGIPAHRKLCHLCSTCWPYPCKCGHTE